MTSGQETQRVNSYNPGARKEQTYQLTSSYRQGCQVFFLVRFFLIIIILFSSKSTQIIKFGIFSHYSVQNIS